MKFKLVIPRAEHETMAFDFMEELTNPRTPLRGTGHLEDYFFDKDYQNWLRRLERERNRELDETDAPNNTFFFIGIESDGTEKIVGICNLNYELNQKLWEHGHHFSFTIRPSERKHGYARIMLYLLLCHCKKCGMEVIMTTCNKENVAAARVIRTCNGKMIASYYESDRHQVVQKYAIFVSEAENDCRPRYGHLVED